MIEKLVKVNDVEDDYRAILRAKHHKAIVSRDGQLGLARASWALKEFVLEGWFNYLTPCAHIPQLDHVVLASRNEISLIRGVPCAGYFTIMCVR